VYLDSCGIVNRRLTMTKARAAPDLPCCPPDRAAPAKLPPNDPEADARLAAFAKALGHPTRVRIIRLLAARDARMCSHLVDELPLAQSTVSEHLRILRGAGLIRTSSAGPRGGYCLVPSALKQLKQLLKDL
jgi:ArsR family transcriptional regulator, arsenate/arsenite/antimonite-responsive transcriptional repressor